jgi:pyruvate/2-oxoglutarate dehydrogenase complex dihydrolipoamide acyltransferase (E2) component
MTIEEHSATAIVMPRIGMTGDDALLLAWDKREGARVEKGETLCQVETDKAVIAIDAPQSGVLLRILVPAQQIVPAGTTLALMKPE